MPRSYIGELLCKQMAAPAGEGPLGLDPMGVGAVLDLCTGSGCLAILTALAFPDATIDASDISQDALADALSHLHRAVIDQFPDAMKFVRPGFDDIDAAGVSQ